MTIALNNAKPLDQADLKFEPLLAELQGNVLKGHGRDHTANIFVEFDPGKLALVRAWLHDFAATRVTSAKQQLRENERFKRHGIPGALFVGVYVTSKGYDYFGTVPTKRPADVSFAAGMKQAVLNDPPVASWEPTFRDLTIHAMILLGDDNKKTLSIATAELIEALRPLTVNDGFVSERIRVEHGNAIRNANGDGLEHFGYVDGVSQPLFFKDENERAKSGAIPSTGSALQWDPFAPLERVLVPDRGSTVPDACGSYFVFRKLEQRVRDFKQAEDRLAQALGLSGEDKERAGAMVVGRFEDGTPLTLDRKAGMIASGDANNFTYDNDKAGLRCPFHAHIRKTNPRGSGGVPGGGVGSVAFDKSRIMARRGIPFGNREVTPEIDSQPEQFPSGDVGLLFMSFQAKLADQFEFIQTAWANNAGFPFSNPAGPSGVDPIVGQSAAPPASGDRSYSWHPLYGATVPTTVARFEQFVQMKGGEYFFAPSLSGLQAL